RRPCAVQHSHNIWAICTFDLRRHYSVFTSVRLSSSARSAGSWLCRNILSSNSRSNRIVSLPELLDSATYKLNRLRPPDGGVAMSMMTRPKVCPCER
ncbi:unnamed protein product, partial [Mycena citricolor]